MLDVAELPKIVGALRARLQILGNELPLQGDGRISRLRLHGDSAGSRFLDINIPGRRRDPDECRKNIEDIFRTVYAPGHFPLNFQLSFFIILPLSFIKINPFSEL